ncbi:MAG: tRNA dihydrouridine synthase DusB [Candidatus Nitrospinota bacterium M3_3B_026]
METGGIPLKSQALMAPIAGITDLPWRRIVMEYGAGMAFSELISANALVRDSKKTLGMLPGKDEPRPVAAQIFGGDAEIVRDAALIAEEHGGADIMDINFGCPVKKVVKTGAGAAALKDIRKAERVVREVARAVKKPVTVKTRIGWDKNSIIAADFVKAMEAAGAAAVTLHGRTAAQGYSGEADWDVISKAASSVAIPVIGNGDIDSPEKALHRLKTSGCRLIMIGRGALGRPWIFRQIKELLAAGSYSPVSAQERAEVILRHLGMMVEFHGEKSSVKKFRAHMAYYSRGLPGATRLRAAVNGAESAAAAERIVAEFFGRGARAGMGNENSQEPAGTPG